MRIRASKPHAQGFQCLQASVCNDELVTACGQQAMALKRLDSARRMRRRVATRQHIARHSGRTRQPSAYARCVRQAHVLGNCQSLERHRALVNPTPLLTMCSAIRRDEKPSNGAVFFTRASSRHYELVFPRGCNRAAATAQISAHKKPEHPHPERCEQQIPHIHFTPPTGAI